jgi:cytochrome P450
LTTGRLPSPPGPRGRWPVGSLPEFGRDLLGFLTGCARDYGDVVHFRLGRRPAYLLNRPELIEQVLVDKQGTFIKHSFFWRHARRLFGAGLLTSEGAQWRRQHRLIAPAFQPERLEDYIPVVVDRTEAMLVGWRSGDRRDLLREMGRLTLGIVARVLFDLELADDVDRLGRAVDRGIEALARRFQSLIVFPEWLPTAANRAFLSSIREFDALVAAMIESRRQGNSAADDLLSRMMRARDDEDRPMSDRQLRDEAVTLLLAGHETTAVALAWTCWLLARHPEAAAKVALEAAEILEDRSAGTADLPRLRFCATAITEAMRLYPPAYVIGRETVRACEIGGFAIPAGATLFMSPWVTHRDPRFYEQPDAFIPERWEAGRCERLPRFAYFPFGGGPRICIGSRFAMMEATLVLATMLRRFRLVATSDRPIRPLPLVTLRPEGGVPLAAIAR